MTGESALLTTAEIAVAFAGFASVVTAFRRREEDGWEPQDVLRFQLMIASSLAVVFFALAPFAATFFGANESETWAFCSGVLALHLAVSMGVVLRRALSLTATAGLNPWISVSFLAGNVAILVVQVLNAAGLIFEREIGPYFLGLLYLLLLGAISFARMLPMTARSNAGRAPDGTRPPVSPRVRP